MDLKVQSYRGQPVLTWWEGQVIKGYGEGKAVIDSLGWTTEMRIPFSQLRFTDLPAQVWGFNADHWNPASR